ncbi:MAG: Menaquinone-cytochrome reductase iron-sulfur subunit [Myxococcaceae bacterium]|nr:Menaquinone-cytochrome reductase iron-sulfur subunit [Myxococcaceae bacterium]
MSSSEEPSTPAPASNDAPNETPADPPRPARRTVTLAIVVGSCAIAAATAIPAAAFVSAPIASKGAAGRWVRTLRLNQLVDGEPKRVAIVDDRRDAWTVERGVELGSVWVVKNGDKVSAYSAVCPHLGCSVNVAPAAGGGASAGFACPCHTSAFGPDGARKSGPAPRDLDTLATRIEEGFVAVDFRRFRIGIPEKVEA